MSPSFEKIIADALKVLKEDGLLVRRKKPVYWSWAFGTALAEAEIEYKERTDNSIYVAFPTDVPTFPGGFLVWTTTPWTLPANVAVAINPNLPYVAAKVNGYEYPLVMAEAAFDRL